MSRSLAREIAMKMVYSELLDGSSTLMSVCDQMGISETKVFSPEKQPDEESVSFLLLTEEDIDYCEKVVRGVSDNGEYLDSVIGDHSSGWSVDRISRVDLSILRLCVFELCFMPEIPHSASINAAVELAKTYGGEKTYSFINGILGSIERSLPETDDGPVHA